MNENLGGRIKSVQREIVRLLRNWALRALFLESRQARRSRAERLARTCGTREKWAIVYLALILTVLGGQAGVAEQIVPTSPGLVNYQGTLYLASDGTTPVTGYQNLEFRLYPTANSDAPVWAELHQDVRVANGEFSVFLGAGEEVEGEPHAPLEEIFIKTAPLWLGVTLGLDAELPVRQLIASAPYALTATSVTTATHGVLPGTIVMFAGPTAPPGWLTCDGATYDGSQPQYTALQRAIGTTWGGTGVSFQVPNFEGRTPIGKTGATAPNDNLGAATVQLETQHLPAHTHDYIDRYIAMPYWEKMVGGLFYGVKDVTAEELPPPNTSNNTPAGGYHYNVQPSTYIYFIIKL